MVWSKVNQFILLVAIAWLLAACADTSMGAMDDGMMQRHSAPVPPVYAGLENPIPADAASLSRGEALYEANCAVCHGDEGIGNGPAAANLDPPPAPIAHTAQMLSDAYLFYRISEGGDMAPFNSAMPAFKERLDENDRWDVINYVRSLESGMMGGGMMNWMFGGIEMMIMMIFGFLLFVVLLVALVLAVLWVVRRTGEPGQAAETPLEILKRRYAQGEIDAEQYETMKRQLEES